jgi:hypothetical protein
MNKKALAFLFLFFFLVSSAWFAQVGVTNKMENVRLVEHLYHYYSGNGEYNKYAVILDDPSLQWYESDPICSFHVPPSKKSDVIVFEYGFAAIAFLWRGHPQHMFWCNYSLKIISTAIPADISIQGGLGMVKDFSPASDLILLRTDKHSFKQVLRRDGMIREFPDWWDVRYISTGGLVPYEISNSILNDVMDDGFDVEISYYGEVEGVTKIWPAIYFIDVTRIIKK